MTELNDFQSCKQFAVDILKAFGVPTDHVYRIELDIGVHRTPTLIVHRHAFSSRDGKCDGSRFLETYHCHATLLTTLHGDANPLEHASAFDDKIDVTALSDSCVQKQLRPELTPTSTKEPEL